MSASTTLHGVPDAVNELLEPHRLKHDDVERHPEWRFDYLCRFDSTLNCAETDAELPRDMHTDYAGCLSRADRLRPDVSAGALVTPDGHWHDSFDFGFRMMNDDEANAAANEKWDKHYWQLMREHSGCWVLETWAHS
ncbi:hypothetical protein [Rhodopirellula baltica]|uniref:hypothetical protein n=1 Tax=Rhodopirellula baltica TaxID=265606 RepID=UPI00114647EC|nr:hypothetical protein [Rhodopirellula baltica]